MTCPSSQYENTAQGDQNSVITGDQFSVVITRIKSFLIDRSGITAITLRIRSGGPADEYLLNNPALLEYDKGRSQSLKYIIDWGKDTV